tara:strand:+ start:297 stop:584 length:288 start_codon:yes stop_codon:yes gene_type:complete
MNKLEQDLKEAKAVYANTQEALDVAYEVADAAQAVYADAAIDLDVAEAIELKAIRAREVALAAYDDAYDAYDAAETAFELAKKALKDYLEGQANE